jgi:16S rRNA processing protein RimM
VYVFGEVLKAQGINGEVKIRIISSFPEHLKNLHKLLLKNDSGLAELHFEKVRIDNQFAIVKFKEIVDRNGAEALKGEFLYITQNELTLLPDDEFYYHDLIGLDAYDQADRFLGKVVDVEEYPANDLVIIRQEDGPEIQVPFVRQFIIRVDLDRKKIVIDPIDGLTKI